MNSAINVLLVCGIITLLHDSPVCAKKKNKGLKPGHQTCKAVADKTSSVRLKCGSKDVIYSLSIQTYNGSGCDVTACSGLQPKVLTDSLLCYSRRNCTISFNNRAPIVKTQNVLCIGKTPSSLQLSYLCVRKKIFLALNRKGLDKGTDEVTLDQGMVVSHATYPWHYSPGHMLNLTIRPKSLDRRTPYVSVPVLEIDSLDKVKMTNYTQDGDPVLRDLAVTKTGSQKFQASSESSLLLVFNTDNSSSTGKGFLICFYWAKPDEDMSKEDICSKLTSKKQKGRKRKKGDRGNRKSKSKSGKKRKGREEKKRRGKRRNKKT